MKGKEEVERAKTAEGVTSTQWRKKHGRGRQEERRRMRKKQTRAGEKCEI